MGPPILWKKTCTIFQHVPILLPRNASQIWAFPPNPPSTWQTVSATWANRSPAVYLQRLGYSVSESSCEVDHSPWQVPSSLPVSENVLAILSFQRCHQTWLGMSLAVFDYWTVGASQSTKSGGFWDQRGCPWKNSALAELNPNFAGYKSKLLIKPQHPKSFLEWISLAFSSVTAKMTEGASSRCDLQVPPCWVSFSCRQGWQANHQGVSSTRESTELEL